MVVALLIINTTSIYDQWYLLGTVAQLGFRGH